MASETASIAERGVATLSEEEWAQCRRRAEVIGPLADLAVVGQ